jgi:hypothetical protein
MRSVYATLLLTAAIVAATRSLATAQPPAPVQPGESLERRLFDDPNIFSQLSGARRSALERKFGRRTESAPAIGASAAPLVPRAAAPSAGIGNTRVNDPTQDTGANHSGDTQSETAVVIGAGNNVVAAFNDSGSIAAGARFTGWALSTDGGGTFADQGVLPSGADGDLGDPVLARSTKTGTILLATLSFNTGHKLLIFRSTDNGATFQAPVNGAPGFGPNDGEMDKEWIAVDNTPGAGFGNVYMLWRNFAPGGGMTFTRSLDDGATWGPSPGVKITTDVGQGASVVVGADHTVHLFWYDQSANPPAIRTARSTDAGQTFTTPATIANLRTTSANGDLGLHPGFRTNSFPQAVASPVNAKLLLVVYNDRNDLKAQTDTADIFLLLSSDGGQTWQGPGQVNDDVTFNDQWQPAMAITPDGSRVCVSWYDRRLDPGNNVIDRFAAIGRIVGDAVAFGPNFRLTTEPFPAVKGVDPQMNPTYMSDYDQMTASGTAFLTTWGDNRGNSALHAGKNPDVRCARISTAGIGTGLALGGTSNAAAAASRIAAFEETKEIPLAQVPAFNLQAFHDAAAKAGTTGHVQGAVQLSKAFLLGETLAMYRLQGIDAQGNRIDAEVKGGFVTEFEAMVPAAKVPMAVVQAFAAQNLGPQPQLVEVVFSGADVVRYGFEPDSIRAAAAAGLTAANQYEAYFKPDGTVLSVRMPAPGQ